VSNNTQEKITKYLDFPFDTFLMLRFEYEVIFNDELVVKLLRIIEYYIETERRKIYREEVNKNGTPEEPLDISRDVWVPISYKLFMSDLYGKVNSENTIKRALSYLIAHRIVFRRHAPQKRYDAPEYSINHVALQVLLNLTKGYQKLIPSFLDTLRNSPPQILTPSEYQEMIPLNSDLSVNGQSRVSIFDTNFNNSNNNKSLDNVITQSANASAPETQTELSEIEKAIALLRANGINISLPVPDPTETQASVEIQETATATLDNVPPSETVSQQELFNTPTTNETKSIVDVPSRQVNNENKVEAKPQGSRRRSKKNDGEQGRTEKPTLKPVLTEEEIAFKARCAGIYQRIVERRGFDFNTKEAVIAERKTIRDDLAPSFTDEQIDFIHMHLDERDPEYWSLPKNQVRISACVIWRHANEVIEFYKRKGKKKGLTSSGRFPVYIRYRIACTAARRKIRKGGNCIMNNVEEWTRIQERNAKLLSCNRCYTWLGEEILTLKKKTFENYDKTLFPRAYSKLKGYTEVKDEQGKFVASLTNFLICGNYGTGKTHLLAATINRLNSQLIPVGL
jgi:hypothetical protein